MRCLTLAVAALLSSGCALYPKSSDSRATRTAELTERGVLEPQERTADFCSDLWSRLNLEERRAFAEAADEKALRKATETSRQRLAGCFAVHRPALVERLSTICTAPNHSHERLFAELQQHVERCLDLAPDSTTARAGESSQEFGSPSDDSLERISQEVDQRCREAPILHHELPPLEALNREKRLLVEERQSLWESIKPELQSLQEEDGRTQAAPEMAAAAERLEMLLNSRAWQRHNDLPLVVDSFTRECIDPMEDKADAGDPKAQKARLIQRERSFQQVRDADRDLSEAVDRALNLLSREPDDE